MLAETGKLGLHDLNAKSGNAPSQILENRIVIVYLAPITLKSHERICICLKKAVMNGSKPRTDAERYITPPPELKEGSFLILQAEEKSISLEYDLFLNLREEVKSYILAYRIWRKASVNWMSCSASLERQKNHKFSEKPLLIDRIL